MMLDGMIVKRRVWRRVSFTLTEVRDEAANVLKASRTYMSEKNIVLLESKGTQEKVVCQIYGSTLQRSK